MRFEFQKSRYWDCVGHGIVVFIPICVFVKSHMFDLNSRFVFSHVILFRKHIFLFVAEHQTVCIGKYVLVDYTHFLTTFNRAMSFSSFFNIVVICDMFVFSLPVVFLFSFC